MTLKDISKWLVPNGKAYLKRKPRAYATTISWYLDLVALFVHSDILEM